MVTLVRRRTRQMLLLTALGLLVLVGAYLLAAQTRIGQTWGDEAYLARVVEGHRLQAIERLLLESITVPVLIGFSVLLVVIGSLRRLWVATALVTGAYLASVISAEVLKAVLPRPELAPAYESLMGAKEGLNTYPSGHATLTTGLVLGAMILIAPRWRPLVAGVGTLLAVTVSCGVVAAGWHRPSDAIGGVALALTWLGGAAAVGLAISGRPAPSARRAWLVVIADVVIVAAVVTTSVVVWADGWRNRVPEVVSAAAFPAMVSVVAIVAAAAVGLVLSVLRDVDLSGPGRLT